MKKIQQENIKYKWLTWITEVGHLDIFNDFNILEILIFPRVALYIPQALYEP